jgi:hypothetical protein
MLIAAPGSIDAHVTAPAARVTKPGQMLAIMGTSTCHVTSSSALVPVPGCCGVVHGGVVSGLCAPPAFCIRTAFLFYNVALVDTGTKQVSQALATYSHGTSTTRYRRGTLTQPLPLESAYTSTCLTWLPPRALVRMVWSHWIGTAVTALFSSIMSFQVGEWGVGMNAD